MLGKKVQKDKNNSSTKKTRMKLTAREKILLIVLGLMLFFAASFFLVITPQTEKFGALEIEGQELQAKVDENNLLLAQESKINNAYKESKQKEKAVSSKYFKELDQPSIIYRMNDILFSDKVSFPSYAFYNPETEDINDFQVKSMSLGLPFDGSYGAIMDTLHKINVNPQKIIVKNISIERNEEQEFLSGNMDVKFYSLDGILPKSEILEEDNPDSIQAEPIPENEKTGETGESDIKFLEKDDSENITSSPNKVDAKDVVNAEATPFKPFGAVSSEPGKDGDATGNNEGTNKELNPSITTKLLSFTGGTFHYLPSHDLIKGNVRRVNKGKEGKSLRVEYNMIAVEDRVDSKKGKVNKEAEEPINGNYALIDFSDNPINISYPPDNLSLWIFSYDYSPITIGVVAEDQLGGEKFFPLSKGIGWTGWSQVSAELSDDISDYPLQIKKFYISMPEGSEGKGVILLDEFEANYFRNIDENGEDASIEPFDTYVVEYGDTFESISKKFYGTTKYAKEIKNLNEIKGNSVPEVGQVLVLRRR